VIGLIGIGLLDPMTKWTDMGIEGPRSDSDGNMQAFVGRSIAFYPLLLCIYMHRRCGTGSGVVRVYGDTDNEFYDGLSADPGSRHQYITKILRLVPLAPYLAGHAGPMWSSHQKNSRILNLLGIRAHDT
jgi:hypothetical protein